MPSEVEHKLAAILSADIVGYSRLMAEDEDGTVRRLGAYRTEITNLVGEHRGRVVDFTGDNFLAEFPTATDAVEAAAEIQRVLKARNAAVPAGRAMEFRIGVHLGEVRVEGERLFGDGVNIAARLEGLAEPGGVCISDDVLHQVQRKLELDFDDLGEQAVKNIPDAVHAYRLRERAAEAPRSEPRRTRWVLGIVGVPLLLGIGSWAIWNSRFASVPASAGVPAIAVLPFDNLSGDPDQEYFVDGMTEDLITRLSAADFLQVIARNSSFVYKGRAVDVKQVSRELGVRYVVEGSVRKTGDRVRISAQLIDATTGHHVWASTYDRELRDIFALQDEISQTIAASIRPEVVAFERDRVMRRNPQSLDAYENVLRGWWHFFKFTRDENARARSFFERAVELDPSYAYPFAGIASTHYAEIAFRWSSSPTRSTAELERAAQRCVALDPREATCTVVVGFVHRAAGRLDQAIAAYERAIQLNPSSEVAHYFLGSSLVLTGRPDEAIPSIETAIRLSPHDPMMPAYLSTIGFAHFGAERYDDAVEWAERSVRAGSTTSFAWGLLASSYAHLGRLDDARAALEQLTRQQPDYSMADAKSDLAGAVPSLLERYVDGLREAGVKEG
jgi:adenylate cyclase